MSEDLATIIYFQIYTPFVLALGLILSYIRHVNKKLDDHVTEFAVWRKEQSTQTQVLRDINENLASNNIIAARTDERVEAMDGRIERIEDTIERRSEIRSNNS